MAHYRRRNIACLAVAALGLMSCAARNVQWSRPDGQAVSPQQIALDRAACEGEMQKANMSAGENHVILGQSRGMRAVYNGCMASKGYLPSDN